MTQPRRKGRVPAAFAWTYAVLLLVWFGLRLGWGDRLWWSALLSSFTPFLFLPPALLLPLALLNRFRHLRLALLIPAALFALLYGRLFLPRGVPPRDPGSTLTVMSFNIWGGSRSGETAHVLAAAGYPDIVALQELTPRMAQVLAEELGAAYPHRLTVFRYAHRGLGVLSRAPLETLPSPGLARLQGCDIQVVRAVRPEGSVILYNLHLHSSNLLRYLEEGVPVAEASSASIGHRVACIEAVLADIRTRQEPVIVLGDFNATDQSDLYRDLRRSLQDAHREAGWGFGHTFPSYRGSFRGIPIPPRQMRIDMILYTNAFRALACRTGTDYGESDHRPVIAELAWR